MTAIAVKRRNGSPAYQAYLLLRVGFTVAPILFGLDKFFNWMVDWTNYLAPWVNDIVPGSGQDFMYFVGAVEIAAGILIAVAPRIGAYVASAWLLLVAVNLIIGGHLDVAVRDVVMSIAAWTLARGIEVRDGEVARSGAGRPATRTVTA